MVRRVHLLKTTLPLGDPEHPSLRTLSFLQLQNVARLCTNQPRWSKPLSPTSLLHTRKKRFLQRIPMWCLARDHAPARPVSPAALRDGKLSPSLLHRSTKTPNPHLCHCQSALNAPCPIVLS